MKIRLALAALLITAPLSAQTTPQPLDPGQQVALRCSAMFGIIAHEQQRGVVSARKWPELGQRGREFFVRLGAELMDKKGFTRETLQTRYKSEVTALQAESIASSDPGALVRTIMDPCLKVLDTAIPPGARRSE